MSIPNEVDKDRSLRNNLLEEIISNETTLEELSIKFTVDKLELFRWMKKLEIRLQEILEQSPDIFQPVDDEEWVRKTEEETKRIHRTFIKSSCL